MSLVRDPIDDDPRYQKILEKAYAKALNQVVAMGYSEDLMGICNIIWPIKKKILREQYLVEWSSPAELNPGIHFD